MLVLINLFFYPHYLNDNGYDLPDSESSLNIARKLKKGLKNDCYRKIVKLDRQTQQNSQ